jgi:HD-GYP domain-containing protein (c-di-GMP phosphodiesterase class II)
MALGTAMAAERDPDRLMDLIVAEGRALCKAEAGALYLAAPGGELRVAALNNDAPVPFAALSLRSGESGGGNPAAYAALTGESVNVGDVHADGRFDFDELKRFDERHGQTTRSLLTVAVKGGNGRPMAVLQFLNARDGRNRPAAFDAHLQEIIETLADYAGAALADRLNARRLNAAELALMGERDYDRMVERLLDEARDLSNAAAGAVFRYDLDGALRIAVLRNETLGLALGGTSGKEVPYRGVHLRDPETGKPNSGSVVARTLLDGEMFNIPDVYADDRFEFAATKAFDERNKHVSRSLLAIPIKVPGHRAVGVLQLLNARDPVSGDLVPFDSTMAEMIRQFADKAAAVIETHVLHQRIISTGLALSAERNHDRLMERILLEAKGMTASDGGTLYLVTEKRDGLRFEIMRNDTLNIAMGGTTGKAIPFPPLRLFDDEGNPNHKNVASHCAISGTMVNIEDAYDADKFDFTGTKGFDAKTGYRSKSFLTVPLKNHEGEVTGVLQLINATDDKGAAIPFSPDIVPMVEALASQAAVALDNQRLIEAQKTLFKSFIKVIAAAIDAKSPYTGGHCDRVPILTQMLARAACNAGEGVLAGFALTDDEWYELEVAGGLHDCGKVTTPEYIVDKATKLETIYNRIHEVRMRFEVLKRDAVVDYLQGLVAGEEDPDQLKMNMDERLAKLDDDFTFVAECNVGGEFMAPDRVERLKAIAEMTWVRTLDDTLGLSIDEMKRREADPPKAPVEELLLADKDWHVVPHEKPVDLAAYEAEGFKIKPGENKYNLGEIYNLCIGRGTLTNEDRFKIQDHIIQTILMLKALPFPKNLSRVAEWAGGHHEMMNGKGYPKGLTREQMSWPARMMAVADIFEALTAADRPYKKPKTMSEALKIMSFMVKDQHIDPDLWVVFLESGVWKDYAQDFLRPDQIDDVDISKYLPQKPAA